MSCCSCPVAIDAYRQVEGTVVLHINFAVKQDSALGLEWLTVVRMGSGLFTPFTVCVLLSLAQIQRFEQPCFDLLKVAVVKSYQDCEHCR
jgi:Fanconi anemia group I protein